MNRIENLNRRRPRAPFDDCAATPPPWTPHKHAIKSNRNRSDRNQRARVHSKRDGRVLRRCAPFEVALLVARLGYHFNGL